MWSTLIHLFASLASLVFIVLSSPVGKLASALIPPCPSHSLTQFYYTPSTSLLPRLLIGEPFIPSRPKPGAARARNEPKETSERRERRMVPGPGGPAPRRPRASLSPFRIPRDAAPRRPRSPSCPVGCRVAVVPAAIFTPLARVVNLSHHQAPHLLLLARARHA